MAIGIVCVPALTLACDVCGCAGGGNSFGLLPLVPRHFAGFRWQAQSFSTDAHDSEPNSIEHFRTLDFWGRWQPHRRLQVIGSVPFQFNSRQYDGGNNVRINRLGDVTLQAQFALLDPQRQSVRRWQHALQVGGGVKLPTGQTGLRDPGAESGLLPPALQPGTGSTDFLASGFYALRRGRWGASLDGTLRIAGENRDGYRFGNRINGSCRAFYRIPAAGFTLLPYAGASIDRRRKDRDQGSKVSDTGGWAAFGTFGMEVFRERFALAVGYQVPVSSAMARGRVTPNPRLNASAVLFFGGKKPLALQGTPDVFPPVPPPASTN